MGLRREKRGGDTAREKGEGFRRGARKRWHSDGVERRGEGRGSERKEKGRDGEEGERDGGERGRGNSSQERM